LGIVQQSGGFVAVDSAPNRGSTFAIYLPAYEALAAAEPTPAALPALSSSGSETILVSEDEEAVREVVARSLRMRGYTVLEARNGNEALHLLQERKGEVHLLLTDLIMPVMGGLELSRSVRRLHAGLPILLMSGHSDDHAALRELIEQRVPFLQKPFRPDALARRVREMLDKSRAEAKRQ